MNRQTSSSGVILTRKENGNHYDPNEIELGYIKTNDAKGEKPKNVKRRRTTVQKP
jgi:hypothetical protein